MAIQLFVAAAEAVPATARSQVVELNRLTAAHGVAQVSDPNSAAHAEMVGLIKALAAGHE